MEDKMKALTNEQLIDVIINYEKYKYNEDTRDAAYNVLKTRKISRQKIDVITEKYLSKKKQILYKKTQLNHFVKKYMIFAFTSLILSISPLFFAGLFFVFKLFLIVDIYPVLTIVLEIAAYVFYLLAMNKNLGFRSIADPAEKITLLKFILYYFLLFSVSPIIIVYNIHYMKKVIKNGVE
jgi:hypothetical protein